MLAKRVLVDITEPRRLCLQELGLRKNFVIWVKEALEGNSLLAKHICLSFPDLFGVVCIDLCYYRYQ